ncbi:putative sema domain protein, partial [Trichinella nativa]
MFTVVYTWPTASKTPINGAALPFLVNVGRTLYSTAVRSGFNFLKLLSQDNRTIVVGTKNAMLSVSLSTLSVVKTLEWPPTADDVDLCLMKGKTQTNDYQIVREFSGVAISPYDPRQNGTALYVPETDEIYTATFADFSGSLPLIYRKPLSGPTAELRTKRYDMKFLSDPHFVSSLDDGDSIYFWFREAAAEYNNCGTAVFSRIARVCKSDQGDHKPDADTWTTYIKARLNCSLSGHVPFYFNEI